MKILLSLGAGLILLASACTNASQSQTDSASGNSVKDTTQTNNTPKKEATAAEILGRKEVPVLCYHQIRDWKASDSKRAHDDIIPPANFRQHIKMLADSGYHTILPDL